MGVGNRKDEYLHKTATESEVKQVASVLLRTAPDRVGGGGRVEEN